jgi:hypothetical protein
MGVGGGGWGRVRKIRLRYIIYVILLVLLVTPQWKCNVLQTTSLFSWLQKNRQTDPGNI